MFSAEESEGRVTSVTPYAGDPDPSPLLASIPDAVHATNRVARPFVRRGWLDEGPGAASAGRGADAFVPLDWDEALRLVAAELRRVREAFGNEAIFGGSYGWSSAGRFHHAKTQLNRFLSAYGGYTSHVTNYSMAAAMILLPHVVGTLEPALGPGSSWDDLAGNTELAVLFGGLPVKGAQVESGGVGTHTTDYWLRLMKANGTRFVNVSPRRDDAPAFLEAEWLPVRPGADTALMLGIAHTLLNENLHDRGFLTRCCVGFDQFTEYLTGATDGVAKDADWAANLTDISAEVIRALARQMRAARTFLAAVLSIQRADHGEQPYWMLVTLAAMLGQIGLPGGGFGFGYGNSAGRGSPVGGLPIPTMPGLENPVSAAIPVARIADMLLNPGDEYEFNGERRRYSDIRLVYWAGGNPFHHHQDTNRLLEAWRRPETVIIHEPWWTATARHADIILPASTTLERNDIGASSRDRIIVAMRKVIEPIGEARSDYAILTDLAERLGVAREFTEGRTEMEWVQHLYDQARSEAERRGLTLPAFAEFWEVGHAEILQPDGRHCLFDDFRRNPDQHPLRTPSGRIEIYSETIARFGYQDCPGHPVWREPREWLGSIGTAEYPLHLLSVQPASRLHSQLDQGRVSLSSKIMGREPCHLNPADAADRGITADCLVRIYNSRGACLAGAVLDDAVRRGVVVVHVGAWWDPVASDGQSLLDRHGNANVLTPDHGTSRLAQGPSALSALVEVELWEGVVEPISILEPPPIESDKGLARP